MEKEKNTKKRYSLDCTYWNQSFDTIEELTQAVLEQGMDPNYEILDEGRGIGETAFDHMTP